MRLVLNALLSGELETIANELMNGGKGGLDGPGNVEQINGNPTRKIWKQVKV